ncbi:hypothetical protein BGX28_003545 [Mortierella sp. GBA30]|nr:hypothetical protein BGX28_003545 [Mortierella sp. GBA30]
MSEEHQFLTVLFDCMLFEHSCWVEPTKPCLLYINRLCRSFAYISVYFSSDEAQNSAIATAVNHFIEQKKLRTREGAMTFVLEMKGNHPLFPKANKITAIYDHSSPHILIPGLNNGSHKCFLPKYTKAVPNIFRDDIAVLILKLRKHVWRSKGSGGTCGIITEGIPVVGVIKYTRAHSEELARKRLQAKEERKERRRQDQAKKRHDQAQRKQDNVRKKLQETKEPAQRMHDECWKALQEKPEVEQPQRVQDETRKALQENQEQEQAQSVEVETHDKLLVRQEREQAQRTQDEAIKNLQVQQESDLKKVQRGQEQAQKRPNKAQSNKDTRRRSQSEKTADVEAFCKGIEDKLSQRMGHLSLSETSQEQPAKDKLQTIDSLMASLVQANQSTSARKEAIFSFIDTVERNLREHFLGLDLRLQVLGSFASGLSTQTSDVDATLILTGTSDNKITVMALAKLFRKLCYSKVSVIPSARVPIVTIWEFEKNISCDISINAPLGVINSKLIHTYQQIDSRVRTVWFALKHLAKIFGILSARDGFLSPYALTLMLITFLQTRTPPLLPRLQQQPDQRMQGMTIPPHDCLFDHDWSGHVKDAQQNKETPAKLLMDFLRFFGHEFDYTTQQVTPKLGKIREHPNGHKKFRRRGKNKRADEEMIVCVMDPFMEDRNVADMCRGENARLVKKCFQSAHRALDQDASIVLGS